MNADLGAIKAQILEYAREKCFFVFHCESRVSELPRAVFWDSQAYPDFHDFFAASAHAGQKLIHLHHREFNGEMMDTALERLEDAPLSREEKRELDNRLNRLKMYAGFTCAIEVSFDHNNNVYIYELETDWYDDYLEIMDELESAFPADEIEDEGGPLGGYYSQN